MTREISVLSTRYSVLGTRYPVLGTRYSVLANPPTPRIHVVQIAIVLLLWAFAVTGLVLLGRQMATRRRSRERMFERTEAEAPAAPSINEEDEGFLTRWLFRAGFRSPSAAPAFVI